MQSQGKDQLEGPAQSQQEDQQARTTQWIPYEGAPALAEHQRNHAQAGQHYHGDCFGNGSENVILKNAVDPAIPTNQRN